MTSPQRVVVGSANPVKVAAVEAGFAISFPHQTFIFQGMDVPSGVSRQPYGEPETYQGALNRARAVQQADPTAAYAVGVEGGVEREGPDLRVFAWIVILHGDRLGRAQTAVYYLPREVADLVQAGHELGEADDIVFGRTNSKQASGSIGLLTDDVITRTTYYSPAVIMALIPFRKPHLTWG